MGLLQNSIVSSRMDYFGGSDNVWSSNEKELFDNEYDGEEDDYVQNEEPLEDLSEDFVNHIKNVKTSLYDNTILSAELGTTGAQDDTLRDKYLNHVNKVYILAIRAQKDNNTHNNKVIDTFPEGAKDAIKNVLKWIEDYFSKNQPFDTIPYESYITQQLHVYPYSQN